MPNHAEQHELLFVKWGGSLITEKNAPFTLNYGVVTRLVKELKDALEAEAQLQVLIGHGGGSFPHPVAQSYGTGEGFVHETSVRGFALCQNAASRLNRLIVEIMTDYAINAVSIQPSACCITTNGKIIEFFARPLEAALEHGLVPVIFGDCVFDTARGCAIVSTEQLFLHLSALLQPARVLIFSLVNGVYTADPQKDERARIIPEIELEQLADVERYLGGSYAVDVTGGMASKVKELGLIAKLGIECEILSGASGNLKRALAGERGIGTRIKPAHTRTGRVEKL